jgi:trigger factor
MIIELDEKEYCKLFVKYEADTDAITKKREEVIKKFKSHRVPGFRPGKASDTAIIFHFKDQVDNSLKNELYDDAFHNVISEKNIKPFGRPTYISATIDDNKFTCEFSIDKQPDFELKEYKDFEIPKYVNPISGEELAQKIIQELRTKHGTTVPYSENDFVQMGDSVIIDRKGFTDDGSVIDAFSADGEIINIGRINIPEFSENMLGMQIGNVREFTLNIPQDYNNVDLAGKTVKAQIKLNMGSKTEPAALNDELAKKIGINTFDELLQSAHSTADSRVTELARIHDMDQISRRLLVNHDFKIPDLIALAEAKATTNNLNKDWNALSDVDKALAISQASDSIRLSLILSKIRDNEPDAQLTDEEVLKTVRENLAKYSQDPDKVLAEVFRNGHLPLVFSRVRDEATLGFIIKNTKIVE